jgi:hypothetical protein
VNGICNRSHSEQFELVGRAIVVFLKRRRSRFIATGTIRPAENKRRVPYSLVSNPEKPYMMVYLTIECVDIFAKRADDRSVETI